VVAEEKRLLNAISAALSAIEAEGSFAVEIECGSEDLQLEVRGVGPLAFPIPAATAQALCAVARAAPFGRRSQTLFDSRVRDCWEIEASRLKIDARRWKQTLEPELTSIRWRLGLPKDTRLTAVLDKLLVYGPGQFFSPHQDSERADNMIGSLVVVLPSRHKGGAFVVQHHEETKVFRGPEQGPTDLSLLAFYADCHHEVQPVTSGYRIALTYHLFCEGPARLVAGHLPAVDRLAACVQAHFSTPLPHRWEKTAEVPDRLVYLLDHEYSEKSLAWGRLKNADRLRADALRQVAERLDCEVYLALADIHECWSCDEDEEWGDRRRDWYDEDLEEDEDEEDGADQEQDEDEAYGLLDLIDSGVELRHWVDHKGKLVKGMQADPGDEEICSTVASTELEPFRSEHEGYMGNYGNTVDRWYHRAAVVLWPRERNFVIKARLSASWAIGEINARIKAGALADAESMARQLVPFWRQSVTKEPAATFAPTLLRVAAAIPDNQLASELLAPLGIERLKAPMFPDLVSLIEHRGLTWSARLLETWTGEMTYGRPSWLPMLPHLCRALVASKEFGDRLAERLLQREIGSFDRRYLAYLRSSRPFLESHGKEFLEDALELLEAAAVLGGTAGEGLVTRLIAPDSALPLAAAGALLRSALARAPDRVQALGLGPLYQDSVRRLEVILAIPPRQPDDWSIELPPGCACALCKALATFLRDPGRVEHVWPLAEQQRGHIERRIEDAGLPVAHSTRRQGRPYSLLLNKQKKLFSQATRLREQQEVLLAWLQQERPSFGGAGTRETSGAATLVNAARGARGGRG
jgi:hypothetical protein